MPGQHHATNWAIHLAMLAAALGTASRAGLGADSAAEIVREDGSLRVLVDGRPFANYVWNDSRVLRPYLADVRTPGGELVTRRHPPREGEDATDHADMHPGIWLGFGDLSGHDFWRNKGAVRHVEFVEEPRSGKGFVTFAVRNRYLAGERTACQEVCRLTFHMRPQGTLIDWDSRFTSAQELAFGDQEEMGLGIRVATPLTVKEGGRIEDSEGRLDERSVWGRTARWCDYRGTSADAAAGLLLMPDPENFRPSWFHARDYGVLVANPFGRKAFTGGEPSRLVVPAGETFRLRFGILVHAGDCDLPAAYDDWLEALAGQ